MILLTMVMSIVSIVKWIPVSCCAKDLWRGLLCHFRGWLFRRRFMKKSQWFYILALSLFTAIVPNMSKVQKRSLKTKAIPTTNEHLRYHFLSNFLYRGVVLAYCRKYIGHNIKNVTVVVKYMLSFSFPQMVLMSSKLLLSLGMLASNKNECSLKRDWYRQEQKSRFQFSQSGEALADRGFFICWWSLDSRWPWSEDTQTSACGWGNHQLKYPWLEMASFHMSGLCTNPKATTWFPQVWYLYFDLDEPPYNCLHHGNSNNLSLPGACMRTWLQTIERQQCQCGAMYIT